MKTLIAWFIAIALICLAVYEVVELYRVFWR